MLLVITPDGTTRCLYGEAIDLHTLGQVTIARGSHVEPDDQGQWWCDMSPIGLGPRLGPFTRRSEALRAEVAWLEANWLCPGS